MRFLDEVINKTGVPLPESAVIIKADAVAKYLFEVMPENVDLNTDFPNIAPPFELMAVEAFVSGVSRDGPNGRVVSELPPHRLLWIAQSVKCDSAMFAAQAVAAYVHALQRQNRNKPIFADQREFALYLADIYRLAPCWISSVVMFDELLFDKHTDRSPSAMSLICIDAAGRGCTAEDGNIVCLNTMHPVFKGLETSTLSFFYPYFLTASFMHCKNVELRDMPNDPGFVRRFTKWHGRPPVQYKEIDITPMRKVIRTTAAEYGTGTRQALHICRGHFKDYREHGLFGKFKGLFWWDQMVRGSEAEGVIKKTYNVKSPR